jgi:N6-L-threonylcarbamoyladenine synthase
VRLATDNAAMIARAGLFHLERGEVSAPDLSAFASMPLPGLIDLSAVDSAAAAHV